MSIHPKYISRRRPKHRYVFVHKSPNFNGRLGGVKFEDGQSQPMPMRRALRLSGGMGSKFRFGFCIDANSVFGECSPEEYACALEMAGGTVASPEALEPDVGPPSALAEVLEALGTDADDVAEMVAEWEAMDEAEARATLVLLTRALGRADQSRCAQECDHGSRCVLEAGHEPADRHDTEHGCICYDQSASFADEGNPGADDTHYFTRAFFESLTKAQLDTWAAEELGLKLDRRKKHASMVEDILAHPKVELVG